VHVFRRTDIDRLRLTLRRGAAPVELRVVHVDLYFFHDLDVVQLNVEVRGEDLPLATVARHPFPLRPRLSLGLGREHGEGLHNAHWRNGWTPPARSSPAPTRRRRKNSSPSSASIAAPAFPSIGPACCGRWPSPIPTNPANCATG
jgi:hypothetical protein